MGGSPRVGWAWIFLLPALTHLPAVPTNTAFSPPPPRTCKLEICWKTCEVRHWGEAKPLLKCPCSPHLQAHRSHLCLAPGCQHSLPQPDCKLSLWRLIRSYQLQHEPGPPALISQAVSNVSVPAEATPALGHPDHWCLGQAVVTFRCPQGARLAEHRQRSFSVPVVV